MKLVVILSIFVAISASLAAPLDDNSEVISSYNEISENSYKFGYDLLDFQKRDEEGNLVQVGDKQVLRVTGSYSFFGYDGKIYKVIYTADENGYQPTVTSYPQPMFLPSPGSSIPANANSQRYQPT